MLIPQLHPALHPLGLYDPQFEHDACGIGAVVDIKGRKQYLLTRMKEKQTFVTSCDDTAFLKTDGEVYRMNGGVLSKA